MSNSIKAVIFDFNGTLFNDTTFHNKAWTDFAARYNYSLSNDELDKHIHGFTNREILHYILKRPLKEDEITILYEEKEKMYRRICLDHPEKCVLAPGAEIFLDDLVKKNILRTIATASYFPNVKLYFQLFRLERWFRFDQVIYDSGEYRGKPHPDMFLAAAAKIGIPVSECMIIEDSKGGIQAAKNADAGTIIAMVPNGNFEKFNSLRFIDQIITDFRQLAHYFISPAPN